MGTKKSLEYFGGKILLKCSFEISFGVIGR
jgi:hypothetical protein